MKKFIFIFFVLIILPVITFAQGGETSALLTTIPIAFGFAAIGGGLSAIGAGIGISSIGGSGVLSIAKQPEALGDIRTNMIIMAALVEGVAFFSIVINLLVVFKTVANGGEISMAYGLAGIGAGCAAMGAGIGISKIGANGTEAIARNPEMVGDIRTNMIIMAALVEGVAFFSDVVCLLVVFK